MSIVCGRPCPYSNGVYCGKGIVLMNQLGQCAEWWGKQGQPIQMRDIDEVIATRNKMKDLQKQNKEAVDKVEKCEESAEINERDAVIGEKSETQNTENEGRTQDAVK